MQTQQEENITLKFKKKGGLRPEHCREEGNKNIKLRLKNFLKAQTVSCPVERACERQREEDLLY